VFGDNVEATNLVFNRPGVTLIEVAQNDTDIYQPENNKHHLPQGKQPLIQKLKNEKGGD